MSKGVDFAWQKPTVAQMRNMGATWAAGYFSNDPTKNWTKSLVSEFLAAGIGVVSVWETTTTRATEGYQAGVDDAHKAESERVSVGLDNKTVIHFAVDEDTDWSSVVSYFAGAASVIGKDRVGVYGGIRIINGAAAAGYKFLWQALAWSAGQWSPHATIRQEGGTVFGGSADVDYSETTDFGQTPRPGTTTGGSDLPTPQDVWAYKGPGDKPDVHQTLQNIATAVAKIEGDAAALAALKTELDAVKVAVTAATAALTKLAADQNVTAAAVQAGVQAELVKLGQALGNLK